MSGGPGPRACGGHGGIRGLGYRVRMVRFTTPAPAFAAATAVPGLLMASTLAIGGIVAWRDPLMRPPRLPNRRPPVWGLPAAGVAYGAAVLAGARVVGRRGRPVVPGPRTLAAAGLSAAAVPGIMVPVFEVARRTWARRNRGPAGTVVVLGCALRDGRPSALLRHRLEKAAEAAARTTPPATIVCCGGVGEGDDVSEAEVMVGWLRERGFADVVAEAESTSTAENLDNAAPLIRRGPVTVVTSDFHVFRTASQAVRAGHRGWRVEGAPTPVRYWATSMLREFLALGTWWPGPGAAAGAGLFAVWAVGRLAGR